MDPNETYRLMTAAWRAGDFAAAVEHAENLTAWLNSGGFEPDCVTDPRYWIGWILRTYATTV
jgi:hypothetical protein